MNRSPLLAAEIDAYSDANYGETKAEKIKVAGIVAGVEVERSATEFISVV